MISGLAIYATSLIPDFLLRGYQYYVYNLKFGDGIIDEVLPNTIFGAFSTAFVFLNIAFIIHFVIRAFWVGVLGLNSVYKKGIIYEELDYSEIYKEEVKKRLGSTESIIVSIDKLASTVFSIAFALVLVLVGVGFIYILFFILMNFVKVILPEDIFELYAGILFGVLIVLLLAVSVFSVVLNMKRFRENPKLAKLHFKLTWGLGNMILPVIQKPSQFILLTFMSNISKKKYFTYGGLIFVAFFMIMMIDMMSKTGLNPSQVRNYYSGISNESTFRPTMYESLLESDDIVNNPIIESPVIHQDYASLFIPYSKLLDTKLELFCAIEEPADSLKRFQKRAALNRENIQCANQFFTFLVDDTDTIKIDLLFSKHRLTNQDGYQSYIQFPDSLTSGKHILNIRRPILDETDATRDSLGRELTFEADIPFWFNTNQSY